VGRTGPLARIVVAALAAGSLLALPATALADNSCNGSGGCDGGGTPVVTPFVDCVTIYKDGSFAALFGYTNDSGPITLTKGSANSISPSNLDGPEPENFKAGTQHGVFALKIPAGVTATWKLHGDRTATAKADGSSPACTPPLSLPIEGNGLGLVLGLIAAGLGGAFFIRRVTARNAAVT
jgi:hypothetical protein